MNTYEYRGTVEEIGAVQSFGANGFTKRECVVGNPPDSMNKYPNPVLFTFKKNNCALLDQVKKGDVVKVAFTVDGRRWDGPKGVKYFTDLTGWKIEVENADGTSVEPMPEPASAPDDLPASAVDDENLPF